MISKVAQHTRGREQCTLKPVPRRAIGRISYQIPAGEQRRLAAEIFSNHSFVWTTKERLFPETRGVKVAKIEVKAHYGKGKSLFEAAFHLANGESRIALVIASSGRGDLPNLANWYREICESDPLNTTTHRLGAEMAAEVWRTRFAVFSVNYFPGETLDKAAYLLEQLAGIPGYPYPEGKEKGILKLSQQRLAELLEPLVATYPVVSREAADKIHKAHADRNLVGVAAAEQSLRKLLLKLDQRALAAHVRFWQVTKYVQTDPRRANVVFCADGHGGWDMKLIDYEFMEPATSLSFFIGQFDIFRGAEYRPEPGVRPWSWTFQENAETRFDENSFFSVIWEALDSNSRVAEFVKAAKELPLLKAARIYKFLIQKGVLEVGTPSNFIAAA